MTIHRFCGMMLGPQPGQSNEDYYEALRRELKHFPIEDAKRAALIAASDRCERIAAATTNPSVMLDELRKAIAVLQADEHPSMPPPRTRPVLRLIEGGLSKI